MIKLSTKKQLIIIIASFSFFMLFLSVTFYSSFLKKEKVKPQTIPEKKQEEKTTFNLKNKPQEGEIETPIDNIALTFEFSKEIDKNSVFVQIKPDTEFEISFADNDKKLVVYPKEKWIYEQDYLVEINLKSKENDELKEKISYSFKIKRPKDSPMDESKIGQ